MRRVACLGSRALLASAGSPRVLSRLPQATAVLEVHTTAARTGVLLLDRLRLTSPGGCCAYCRTFGTGSHRKASTNAKNGEKGGAGAPEAAEEAPRAEGEPATAEELSAQLAVLEKELEEQVKKVSDYTAD